MFSDFTDGQCDHGDETPIDVTSSAVSNPRSERARFIQERLAVLRSAIHKHMVEVGVFLEEIHREQHWRGQYKSFAEYVDEEVGISIRKAQELMRVIRACQAVGVSTTEIADVGWSKLAIVVHNLTSENATQFLRDVKKNSYSELKAKFGNRKKSADEPLRSSRRPEKMMVSEIVDKALRVACAHTREFDLQPNLEFMAAKFLELCPFPSRIPQPVMN